MGKNAASGEEKGRRPQIFVEFEKELARQSADAGKPGLKRAGASSQERGRWCWGGGKGREKEELFINPEAQDTPEEVHPLPTGERSHRGGKERREGEGKGSRRSVRSLVKSRVRLYPREKRGGPGEGIGKKVLKPEQAGR